MPLRHPLPPSHVHHRLQPSTSASGSSPGSGARLTMAPTAHHHHHHGIHMPPPPVMLSMPPPSVTIPNPVNPGVSTNNMHIHMPQFIHHQVTPQRAMNGTSSDLGQHIQHHHHHKPSPHMKPSQPSSLSHGSRSAVVKTFPKPKKNGTKHPPDKSKPQPLMKSPVVILQPQQQEIILAPPSSNTQLANDSMMDMLSSPQPIKGSTANLAAKCENSHLLLFDVAEKTPMCLINELARYNKIQHQYRLTDEAGPPHKKTFNVCLKLGECEEYIASGPSIKKAQHAAAAIALEKTKLKHPPPKSRLVKNSKALNQSIF